MSSFFLFAASYPFTKNKLNAIGVSFLPAALRSYRRGKGARRNRPGESFLKRKLRAFLLTAFHLVAVFSGFFDCYPLLIRLHAVACIATSVWDSIEVRREKEEREREEAERRAARGPSVAERLKDWMFGIGEGREGKAEGGAGVAADAGATSGKSRTARAQKAAHKTKSILKGKCDSTTDDLVWGTFQVSFVFLDHTIGKTLSCAWLLFLLTILEEAVLNPKLNRGQRVKRCVWIVGTGYFCGRLVFGARLF